MAERTIRVEVVYAGTGRPVVRQIELAEGSTVMQAIDAAGLAAVVPGGAIDPSRLGIFARKVPPDRIVRQGDRIEVYRPLMLDPMEARRRRAR
ncbi:RnfH family protein [Rhodanobacter sp. FW510-R12]|uniref:RnfH family protein n=1 Tax=unclassified Rhodanobacter TaxID=2621553 RepID=UPI0007A997EA|nr:MULTISPECIES: RnfH family protein [unclassified Rhodanobacter]KZC18366.1 RnfH family protein [Rhodanobacter sp. FW104-R8]KZC29031.1 RnfH family protein [Rhodanobacter sp. FW510-T8]KZC30132.1 RnfH family protein [Rhodanobacter sp. FW510-R10]